MGIYVNFRRLIREQLEESTSGGTSGGNPYPQYATRNDLPSSEKVDSIAFINDEDLFVVYNGSSWDSTGISGSSVGINDSNTSLNETWSSNKISSELSTKSESNHLHDGVYIKDPEGKTANQFLKFDGVNWVTSTVDSSGGSTEEEVLKFKTGSSILPRKEGQIGVNTDENKIYIGEAIEGVSLPSFTSNIEGDLTASWSSSAGASYEGWKALDKSETVTNWVTSTRYNEWLELEGSSARAFNTYEITTGNNGTYAPKDFRLQGSDDGVTWNDLDIQTEQVNWGVKETRSFTFENETGYLFYRLFIDSGQEGTNQIHIMELNLSGLSYEWVDLSVTLPAQEETTTEPATEKDEVIVFTTDSRPLPVEEGIIGVNKESKELFVSVENSTPFEPLPAFTSFTNGDKTVTASNSYSSNYAWKVFEGGSTDDMSRWLGQGQYDQWVQIDLGSNPQIFNEYTMRSGNSGSFLPRIWRLEGSQDGVNYVTLDSQDYIASGNAWGAYEGRTFPFSNNTAYRYYRLYSVESGSTNYTSISELIFNGVGAVSYEWEKPNNTEKNFLEASINPLESSILTTAAESFDEIMYKVLVLDTNEAYKEIDYSRDQLKPVLSLVNSKIQIEVFNEHATEIKQVKIIAWVI